MSSNPTTELEQLAITTLRMLAVDGVEKANSGHPGMPMGMADSGFCLFNRFMRHDPTRPDWPDRDRFILSAGHGSMLLYGLLHLSGYDLPLSELRRFRQWESRTPGHPELDCTPGVETTTGPLGQGFATGVGLALAARLLGARLNTADFSPVSYRVFGIVSDGDLMEGVASEAASLAGHLGLGNLNYIYDDNHISIEGSTELAFSEDVAQRFVAYGWHVQHVDAHNLAGLCTAIEQACARRDQPSLICARSHIAYGSPGKQDSAAAHGAPLGPDEVRATKQALNWPLEPTFYVPDEVRQMFADRLMALTAERQAWDAEFAVWRERHPDKAALWDALFQPELPADLFQSLIQAAGQEAAATRALSGKVLQTAADLLPGLIGGSADLAPSNQTALKGAGSIASNRFEGRNMHFGVREHAMGAVLNGMSLSGGLIPYGGTFLVFADYMRPAIRLASLMKQGVIYIFTHDSIFVGEDGPTHQPIEHLASLRIIPGLQVIRPADPLETAAAWTMALRSRKGPSVLSLTRQKVPVLERPADFQPEDALRGGYVLVGESGTQQALVIASGSETALAAGAARKLGIRAVSMPCLERFLAQEPEYRDRVLPRGWRVAVVEASCDPGWYRLCGPDGLVIGMRDFGASAPAEVLAEKFGFTARAVEDRLSAWLGS